MSTQSFADLGVSKTVVAALQRRGINEPFAVQRLVIADVLAGHDVLAKSPTGSGKTLAFGVPMVDQTPNSRQTLFFSATLDGQVGRIADAYTSNARSHEHCFAPEQKADIEHRFLHVRHEAKLDHLIEELGRKDAGRTLVFVRTK